MQSLKYTNIDKEQQSRAEREVLQSDRNQIVKKSTLEQLRYESPEHASLEISGNVFVQCTVFELDDF